MKKFYKPLIVACGLLGASTLYAQDSTNVAEEPETETTTEEVTDIYDIDLEDLLNMEVTVASKQAERLSDAPGMITSYSSKDIENYGYYTLSDLSSITSGYSNFTAYGEKMLETRGQKAGSWNNQKHLVLVDGIPMNHARAYSAPIENQLPLFMADQVEFMKGPGSALYGTSAFYGVVSVTPKSLKENGTKAEAKFSAGNYNGERRFMTNILSKTDEGEATVAVGYYGREFSADYLGSTGTQNPNLRNWNSDNSYFINGAYKLTTGALDGLKIGMIYMKRQSNMGDGWSGTLSPHNQQTWEEIIPYLKYNTNLSEKLSLNSYVKYNHSAEVGQYPTGSQGTTNGFDFRFNNVEVLGELQYSINEKHSIIGGINYDWRQQAGSPATFDYTGDSLGYTYGDTYKSSQAFNIVSAYAQYQAKFDILSGLSLTAGGRLDNGISETNKYSQLSPRIAVVQKFTDWFNAKILYGSALRTPGLKEVVGNSEANQVGIGNSPVPSDLEAEVIQSFEGGVTFTPKRWNIGIAVFNNVTKKSLDQTSNPNYTDADGNAVSYFENSNYDIKAQGIEIDLVFALNKNLKVFANYATAKAKYHDGDVETDFTQVPDQKINSGVAYTLPLDRFPATISLINKNVSGYFVTESSYGKDKVDGYNFLDANFLFPVTKNIGLEMQVKNITNEEFYQPSITSNPGRDILYPSRTFLFTLSAKL